MNEKIKKHFQDHKVVYISVGLTAVAGITWVIVRGRHAELLSGSDTAETSVFVRPLSILSNRQTTITNIIHVVEREGRGHPGYIIRCLENNQFFASQKEAAESQGVNDAIMSLHVRGKLEDVNGLHFERVSAA